LVTTFIQYGALVFGNTTSRLRANLLTYDLVSHSFLTRAIAVCDSNLNACAGKFPAIGTNPYLNTYPDGFHVFFGTLFRQGLLSGIDSYLLTWGVILFSSFSIGLALSLSILQRISVLTYKAVGRSKLNPSGKLSKLLALCFIGVSLVYPFNLGYINFSLAVLLIISSIFLLLEKLYMLSAIAVIVACEFWSFFYFLSPLFLIWIIYAVFRRNVLQGISIVFIYLYFLGIFLFSSISSRLQTESVYLNGTHIYEPFICILFTIYLIIRIRRSFDDELIRIMGVYSAILTVTISGLMLYLAIFKGIMGSYYVYKSCIALFSIQILLYILATELQSKTYFAFLQHVMSILKLNRSGSLVLTAPLQIENRLLKVNLQISRTSERIALDLSAPSLKKFIKSLNSLVEKKKRLELQLMSRQSPKVLRQKSRFPPQLFMNSVKIPRFSRNFVFLILILWILPSALLNPISENIRSQFLPESPLVIAYSRLPQNDSFGAQSNSIIGIQSDLHFMDSYIFLEPGYWYQSTHWLNNLNFSWSFSLQKDMDILYQKSLRENLSSSKLADLLTKTPNLIHTRVISTSLIQH